MVVALVGLFFGAVFYFVIRAAVTGELYEEQGLSEFEKRNIYWTRPSDVKADNIEDKTKKSDK